jgi:hypothetical protein
MLVNMIIFLRGRRLLSEPMPPAAPKHGSVSSKSWDYTSEPRRLSQLLVPYTFLLARPAVCDGITADFFSAFVRHG